MSMQSPGGFELLKICTKYSKRTKTHIPMLFLVMINLSCVNIVSLYLDLPTLVVMKLYQNLVFSPN
jgi:hypothetical protein